MAKTPYMPVMAVEKSYLTKAREIAAGVIQYTLANPGHASVIAESEQVSLRKIMTECNGDIDQIKVVYGNALGRIFSRYFPNGEIRVVVSSVADEDRTKPAHLLVNAIDTTTGNPVIQPTDISDADGKFTVSYQ